MNLKNPLFIQRIFYIFEEVNLEKENNKQIWEFPWKYKESFIVLSSLVVIGFLIDFINNSFSPIKLSYPTNIYFIAILISVSVIFFIVFKKNSITNWLSSVYLAISSIVYLFVFVLLMGFFNQNTNEITFLNNILYSKSFIIVLLFVLINLLFVILSRLNKLDFRNILFIINHLGVFILIITLSFGAGDIEKYTLKIDKENYVWEANIDSNYYRKLPFALRLIDFSIEMFPAKIAIVNNKTDKIIAGNKNIISENSNKLIKFKSTTIKLLEYSKNSVLVGNKYFPVNDIGAPPSAKLLIKSSDKTDTCWVSCGSFVYPSDFYSIDSNYTLVMLEPEPKSFKSDIEIILKDSKKEKYIIEVNKPISIKGWDIYQTDYNKEMGQWSDYSVIEIVRDPWLKYVYLGIFMMIAGAIGLIIIGKSK